MPGPTECGFCKNGHMTKSTADYAHKAGDVCRYCRGTGVAPMSIQMPAPQCEMGYSEAQITEAFGAVGEPLRDMFETWMRGQTYTLCEGKSFNHDTKEYEVACGGTSHGNVYYVDDLRRFLNGMPIVD